METNYEKNLFKAHKKLSEKQIKLLLPVKTKNGFFNKQRIKKIHNKEKNKYMIQYNRKFNEKYTNNDLISQISTTDIMYEPISMAYLLRCRKETLQLVQYKIATLATEILENPEEKSTNFSILLNYMEEKNLEVYITIRKLATISLLEIFQDFLPLYNIRLINKNEINLKKETLHLQTYEASILRYYKDYLQKLERMANSICKKGYVLYKKEENFHLGILAIICMINLLIDQQHFNYSQNIANFLVPFLDSKYSNIRKLVANCLMQIFEKDKYGKLSLSIVRCIFQYIKKQKNLYFPEIILILLKLRLEHINLRNDEQNRNKFNKLCIQKNSTFYNIGRKNNLEPIKKELVKIKIEQNERNNLKNFTEITDLVFKIYFYILKASENIKILPFCFEGLTKFARHISSHFQTELFSTLHKLLVKNSLTFKEQLHCIHASFIISSYETTKLSVDIIRLFIHLYKILIDVYIGRNIETDILIKILQVFMYRRNNMTPNRLFAFIKRICGITLNLEHNCALGIICVMIKILYKCKSASILFDTDYNIGDGIYLPEINDPDFCNVHSTSLWEIVALQRHYHIALKNLSKNITKEIEIDERTHVQTGVFKFSPEVVYNLYDSSKGLFKPATLIPAMFFNKNRYNNLFTNRFKKQNQNIYNKNFLKKCCVDIFNELDGKKVLKNTL